MSVNDHTDWNVIDSIPLKAIVWLFDLDKHISIFSTHFIGSFVCDEAKLENIFIFFAPRPIFPQSLNLHFNPEEIPICLKRWLDGIDGDTFIHDMATKLIILVKHRSESIYLRPQNGSLLVFHGSDFLSLRLNLGEVIYTPTTHHFYLIDAKTIKPMQSFIANSGRTAENCCCSQSQADLNNGGEDDGQNEANKDFEKYSRNRQ